MTRTTGFLITVALAALLSSGCATDTSTPGTPTPECEELTQFLEVTKVSGAEVLAELNNDNWERPLLLTLYNDGQTEASITFEVGSPIYISVKQIEWSHYPSTILIQRKSYPSSDPDECDTTYALKWQLDDGPVETDDGMQWPGIESGKQHATFTLVIREPP